MAETRIQAAANAEGLHQCSVKSGDADASANNTAVVPSTFTPPPVAISVQAAFASDGLAPISKAKVASFRLSVLQIKKPTSPDNLFSFVHAVCKLIESTANMGWLLSPLSGSISESATLFSMSCANCIKECVPSSCYPSKSVPYLTYDLIEFLKEAIPSPFFVDPRPIPAFPSRTRNETMDEYVDRCDQWISFYLPAVDKHPEMVVSFAKFMWSSHARLYKPMHLEMVFMDNMDSFTVMEEVYTWFRKQPLLRRPLSATASD